MAKCKTNDWSCPYHACMSDCQKEHVLKAGLNWGNGKCCGGHTQKKQWTDKETEELKRLFPETKSTILAELFCCTYRQIINYAYKLRLKKSINYLKSESCGRLFKGHKRGIHTRFIKGDKPFNAGMKKDQFMSSGTIEKFIKNQFTKGHLPHNTKSNGAISFRKDKMGNTYKFIRTGLGKWQHLHVFNWIREKGNIPKGYIVIFKNGDKMNCHIENLELITRKENMSRNTIHRYPEEVKQSIKALSKLKKIINGKE
jgi:hypothetical protein